MEPSGRFAAWATPESVQAFTLVESLFTIGLIVLLSAISLPTMAGMIAAYRARTAAWQIAGDLRLARTKAVSTNRSHRVCFGGCGAAVPTDGYLIQRKEGSGWEIDSMVQAPNTAVHVTSNVNFTFGTSGEGNGGTVTLVSGSRSYEVRAHYTGRVRVCKDTCS